MSGRGSGSGMAMGSGRTKMGDAGGPTMVPTRALARSPVAWTVDPEAALGGEREEKTKSRRARITGRRAKSETNRIRRTRAARADIIIP